VTLNGAGLSVIGSSNRPVLQIVPVLSGYSVSGGTLTLSGGFVEGVSTYTLGGTAVADTAVNSGPDCTTARTRRTNPSKTPGSTSPSRSTGWARRG
jgi:hypothetical protein